MNTFLNMFGKYDKSRIGTVAHQISIYIKCGMHVRVREMYASLMGVYKMHSAASLSQLCVR